MRLGVLFFMAFSLLIGSAAAQTGFENTPQGATAKEGFFDLYLDEDESKVMAVLPASGEDGTVLRFIYANGLTAGLGSNPIGLDRGAGSNGIIVKFRKVGGKLIAEQENWQYRATADRAAEKQAVEQSFASSFLWSTDIIETAADGRLLVDLSGFLTRDQFGIARSLKFGSSAAPYKLSGDRSFPDTSRAFSFPDNVEIDAYLTFDTAAPNSQTRATAADGRSVTLVLHHSFVRLPNDGYETRKFDQRTANIGMGFYDYSADLGDPIVTRLSRRFRLEKEDPNQAYGPAKDPIIFYVDNGAPEQIRDALIEGATWWNEGFEAAGFENAFQVKVLPEDAHPLDVRYNVINWVHRQTRGWSYGGSVSDPRTGEIIKANVILGSQRVRQDRMIFEGLAGAAKTGTGDADDPIEVALARIRQLSAHEVGHTIGFAHNFAASSNDRASVMDYPAPYIRPTADGGLDFSEAYDVGLGAWDVFTVQWLYTDFADEVDESEALDALTDEAYGTGLRFIADSHARSPGTAHPYASVWDNGSDAIATLDETMEVRRIGLDNFGLGSLADGRPSSDLNAVIVPIYLYHRYQVAAAAKSVGGLDFAYGVTGEDVGSATPVSLAEQRRAIDALVRTVDPAALDLSDDVLNLLTPGDVGFAGAAGAAETFPNRTGPVFDLLAAADVASNLTFSTLFHPARAERMVAYEMRNSGQLGLGTVIDYVADQVFLTPQDARRAAIARTVQLRFVTTLIGLSQRDGTSGLVRSAVDGELAGLRSILSRQRRGTDFVEQHHRAMLVRLIERHLAGEMIEPLQTPSLPTPPGSPIGSGEACWHCAE